MSLKLSLKIKCSIRFCEIQQKIYRKIRICIALTTSSVWNPILHWTVISFWGISSQSVMISTTLLFVCLLNKAKSRLILKLCLYLPEIKISKDCNILLFRNQISLSQQKWALIFRLVKITMEIHWCFYLTFIYSKFMRD